jgi:hypothetical protein
MGRYAGGNANAKDAKNHEEASSMDWNIGRSSLFSSSVVS